MGKGLGGCYSCIKYLMFAFNFLFWVSIPFYSCFKTFNKPSYAVQFTGPSGFLNFTDYFGLLRIY